MTGPATDVLGHRLDILRRRLRSAGLALSVCSVGLMACSSGEPSAPIDQSVLIRVDAASGEVTSVVPTGPGSRMMATAAGQIWVLNGGDGTLSRIDPASERVTTVDIGEPAAMTGDADALWVAVDGNRLVRLDGATGAVEESLQIGDERLFELGDAGFPAVGGGYLWLTVPDLDDQSAPQELWQLEPSSGEPVARWPIGVNPIAPLVDGDYLWIVTRAGLGDLSRMAMASGSSTSVLVAGYPERLASGLGAVWVGHRSKQVWRVEPGTGEALAKIDVNGPVRGIALGGGLVWVATGTTVFGIDPSTNEVTRTTDLTAHKRAAADVGGVIYLDGSLWLTAD